MGNKLPFGMGNLDWGDWLYGLFSGFIGGGASAVASGVAVSVIDPIDWGPQTGHFYELVISVFLVNGLMTMMAFLRTKPLPAIKEVKTTVESTVQHASSRVVTTVEEKHIEPLEPSDLK